MCCLFLSVRLRQVLLCHANVVLIMQVLRQDELFEEVTEQDGTDSSPISVPSTATDNHPKEKWLKKRTMYKVKVSLNFFVT